MKKSNILRYIALSGIALSLAACGNLSKITDEGTTDNPVFPEISDSVFNSDGTQEGSWPNWENVRQIERGMNKDQLYNLIGRPHFSEGLYGVREWDYVFHYRENGEHKVCQYKVLFDKNMDAQSFYWYPNGCNGNASFSLKGDFLFEFDQDNLTEQGKKVVDDMAAQLVSYAPQHIKVEGYTDRLGSVEYNLDLSQRRANTVKARLQEQGVKADIQAVGYGKANQVKACENESGQALKACLSPNRRVEILASGGLQEKTTNNGAGLQGPTPLYQQPVYRNVR